MRENKTFRRVYVHLKKEKKSLLVQRRVFLDKQKTKVQTFADEEIVALVHLEGYYNTMYKEASAPPPDLDLL